MADNTANSAGLDPRAKSTRKKCETFGCRDVAKQMYQIAPGTNVWLCDRCKREMEKEKVR